MDHLKELLSFPEELQAMKNLLQLNRQRLESDMDSPLARKAGYNQKHGDATTKLSKAIKELGTELRAWIDKVDKKSKTLGQANKIDLVCRYITSLPVGVRKKIYEELVAFEAKWPQGVNLVIPEEEEEEDDQTVETPGCPTDTGDLAGYVPDFEIRRSDPEQHVRGSDE
jgi:hypothetical protein